jgi:hypothetical protein
MVNEHEYNDLKSKLKQFDGYHYIFSTWKLSISQLNPTINQYFILIKSLTKVIILNIFNSISKSSPCISKENKYFFYVRYSGVSSFGILNPIIKKLNDNSCIIAQKDVLKGMTKSSISINVILNTAGIKVILESIAESYKLAKLFEKKSKYKFNAELMYCYFQGILVNKSFQQKLKSHPRAILIVETDATNISRGLIEAFRSREFKSICLQHGTFGDHQFPLWVDKYYVWGDFYNQQIKKFNIRSSEIISAGYPRLEEISFQLKNENIPSSVDPIILIISNTHGRIFDSYLSAFFDVIKSLIENRFKIFVKLHPAESMDSYDQYLSNEEIDSLNFFTKESLIDLIDQSRYTFLIDSAAVLEILSINRPLLFLHSNLIEYPNMGIGVWVTADNIIENIAYLQKEENYRNLIENQKEGFKKLISNFGNSAKIICEDLQKIVSE